MLQSFELIFCLAFFDLQPVTRDDGDLAVYECTAVWVVFDIIFPITGTLVYRLHHGFDTDAEPVYNIFDDSYAANMPMEGSLAIHQNLIFLLGRVPQLCYHNR